MTFTQDELRRLCREWQDRLGLAHWTIKAEILRDSIVIDVNNNNGFEMISGKKTKNFPNDIEQGLVHGLLRIMLKVGDVCTNDFLEQALDQMAPVMVRLKREKVSDKVGEKVGD